MLIFDNEQARIYIAQNIFVCALITFRWYVLDLLPKF